jgi:DNA-binding transcriptional ArsR family regulator
VTSSGATDAGPVAERTISDIDSIKALSDPMRLRILETMIQAPDEAWTVKRLAGVLGVGPTKLYHHIGILEERDFIRVAGTRVVSGIIETSYRVAQLSVRLDRSLLAATPTDEATAAIDAVLQTLFDAARQDVAAALRSGAMQIDPSTDAALGLLRQDLTALSDEQAAAFKRRLIALIDEFDVDGEAIPEGTRPFGLLIALYPVGDRREEATDD